MLAFVMPLHLQAQNTEALSTIKVYVDCSNGGECFLDFVRQEVPIVGFVRDRLDADVHIVVNAQYNSSSAAKYRLFF